MPAPNSDFRPDPSRAIYVQGAIDQDLLDRLTPQIVKLHRDCREAITVYIDSPGGNPSIAEQLRLLLLAPDQDSTSPCRLITVVTSGAASAAADFLSSGDYAIAYPNSYVYFHGSRRSWASPLTAQDASRLNESLTSYNDRHAIALARRSFGRFVFHYLLWRSKSTDHLADPKQKTELDCFLDLLTGEVSDRAKGVLTQAQERNRRYEHLIDTALANVHKKGGTKAAKREATVEAALLRELIDLALEANTDESWTFHSSGLAQLNADFILLSKYVTHQSDEYLDVIVERWGDFCLSENIRERLKSNPTEVTDQEKANDVKGTLAPVWVFFVALCHVLQDGEHQLTATDAYYLGLVDEVLGSQLPCPRMLVEYSEEIVQAGVESAGSAASAST